MIYDIAGGFIRLFVIVWLCGSLINNLPGFAVFKQEGIARVSDYGNFCSIRQIAGLI